MDERITSNSYYLRRFFFFFLNLVYLFDLHDPMRVLVHLCRPKISTALKILDLMLVDEIIYNLVISDEPCK